MLVHYLREHNEIVPTKKSEALSSKGALKGVLVAIGPGFVGWSLWNKCSEIHDYVDKQVEFWTSNGMDTAVAWEKAEKRANIRVKFSKEEALSIAVSRAEFMQDHGGLTDRKIPESFKQAYDFIVERSYRWYKPTAA